MNTPAGHQPNIYTQARKQLEASLLRDGFVSHSEHVDHQTFGSAYVIYHRKHRPIFLRLAWDGCDACLDVQVSSDGKLYHPLFATDGNLSRAGSAEITAQLTRLVATVVQHLSS